MWRKAPKGDVLAQSAEEAGIARVLITEGDRLLGDIQRDLHALLRDRSALGFDVAELSGFPKPRTT